MVQIFPAFWTGQQSALTAPGSMVQGFQDHAVFPWNTQGTSTRCFSSEKKQSTLCTPHLVSKSYFGQEKSYHCFCNSIKYLPTSQDWRVKNLKESKTSPDWVFSSWWLCSQLHLSLLIWLTQAKSKALPIKRLFRLLWRLHLFSPKPKENMTSDLKGIGRVANPWRKAPDRSGLLQ